MIHRWHRATAILLLAVVMPMTAAAVLCSAMCEPAVTITQDSHCDTPDTPAPAGGCALAALCALAQAPAMSAAIAVPTVAVSYEAATGTLPISLPTDPPPPLKPPSA